MTIFSLCISALERRLKVKYLVSSISCQSKLFLCPSLKIWCTKQNMHAICLSKHNWTFFHCLRGSVSPRLRLCHRSLNAIETCLFYFSIDTPTKTTQPFMGLCNGQILRAIKWDTNLWSAACCNLTNRTIMWEQMHTQKPAVLVWTMLSF